MNSYARRFFITLFVIGMGALAAQDGLAQSSRENAADAEWLTRVLEIKAGTIVGEIGAGDGELTFALAKVVGESGRVFTNELNKDRAKAIESKAEKSNVKNVTVVEGHAAETNFPDQCCDAIFMRNVYHHFGDPPAMNASLLKSLKPGGRLAVIDFTPPPPSDVSENPPGRRGEDNHHGITVATLEKELKAAGFEIVSAETKNRAVTVVGRRPLT
jgi:ubiquinone/menaquinone biosynthesis C-methylase UbiE